MRKCVWCRKAEDEVPFKKVAHTVPQGLGCKDTCRNVCDLCNLFFGSHYMGMPAIETVIKEAFNISSFRYLHSDNDFGRNKSMAKFSSIYFNVDPKNYSVSIKLAFKFKKYFQENICRQLKKGLYKMFLEETERQYENGFNEAYDFIREYSRYNIGDYPVLYFERSVPVITMPKNWASAPKFIMDPEYQLKYLVREPGFFEFEFLGHVFGIATSRNWELFVDNYLNKSMAAKQQLFRGFRLVNNFNDVDLALSILDDNFRS